MSTEILSTSLGETLVLKDVIQMADGIGAVALGNRDFATFGDDGESSGNFSDSGRITLSTEGDDGLTADQIEELERTRGGKQLNLDTQITMGGDNTDGGESYDPFPNKKVNLQLGSSDKGGEFSNLSDSGRIAASFDGDDWPDKEHQGANSLTGSARITMGGEEDLSDDGYEPENDPLRRDKAHLKSLRKGVLVTMGGVNGDDTESGRGPGSSDPFENSEAERKKGQ